MLVMIFTLGNHSCAVNSVPPVHFDCLDVTAEKRIFALQLSYWRMRSSQVRNKNLPPNWPYFHKRRISPLRDCWYFAVRISFRKAICLMSRNSTGFSDQTQAERRRSHDKIHCVLRKTPDLLMCRKYSPSQPCYELWRYFQLSKSKKHSLKNNYFITP